MAKEDSKDLEARFAELAARNAEMVERNAALMAALEAKLDAAPAASGGITPDVLEAILTRATKAAGQASEVLASKLKPENADHRHLGPFEHKDGGLAYPKDQIAPTRAIVWGSPLKLDELTYAEVLACAALDRSLRRSERRLARDGKWKALVSDDDLRVTISVPVKTIDDRQDLPSFIQIVNELTTGDRAPETADILAELQLLKGEMAKLQLTAAH